MDNMVIADRLAVTARVAEMYRDDFQKAYGNDRYCPFVSEFRGMTLMLNALGIEYDFEFDDNYRMTAVVVGDARVEL